MAHNIMTVINFYISQLFLCISFFLLNSVAGGAISDLQKCQKGFFFDDVLKKCENCYAVCIDAALQRTEDKCALCKVSSDLPPSKPVDPHESSPAVWVSVSAVASIILIIGIFLIFFKSRSLGCICQHQQARARISLQGIIASEECAEGQDNDMEHDNLPEIRAFIENPQNPQHDPQNAYDYKEQRKDDLLTYVCSGQNMQREITEAYHNGQIRSLVHAEHQESIEMGPAGINIQETLLKTL